MAEIKFGEDTIRDISDTYIKKNNNIIEIVCDGYNIDYRLNRNTNGVRIEVKGNVSELYTLNAIVYGNIDNASARNCVDVEGFINNYQCPRGRISINRDIYVCHGAEKCKRNGYPVLNTRVIHIDGDLRTLKINVGNISCENVIFGNVHKLVALNCITCRGNIEKCEAGNMISMTGSNKRTAKSTEELLKRRKEEMDIISNSLEDIFKTQ